MDDVGGVVGVLVHADGVGGASFFIIYLRGCEMLFEVFPCLSALGLSFHFSMASAEIRAMLRMVLPMLMRCGSVSGVP